MIALDTETCLIQPGLLAPPLVCVSLASEIGDRELYHHTKAQETVFELLTPGGPDGEAFALVGHNIAYDMAVLCTKWPDLMPLVFDAYAADRITDTMLREKLQHIALGVYRSYENTDGKTVKLGYSLAACVARHCKRELNKEIYRLNYSELIDTPLDEWPEGARQYAIDDAVATLDLWRDQESDGKHLLADQYRRARAAFWQHLTACWGIVTDSAAVQRFKQQIEDELADARKILQDAGLVRKNGTRDTAAAKRAMVSVCARLGRDVERNDPTAVELREASEEGREALGSIKLDRGTCENTNDSLLCVYAELSSLMKCLSTDVPLLESGTTTPIQPRYDLLETGRTSTSPNVQNWPTGLVRPSCMRECVVPRPGKVFAIADYGQIELRTVAQVCQSQFGYSQLRVALNAGLDPHLEMACRIVGCKYEEGLRRREQKDNEIERARQAAKVANFGFPGGLGFFRFVEFAKAQYNVLLTEEDARTLKRVWLETWPEFNDYFAWVGATCETGAGTITQLGVGRQRGNCSFTEACNSYFQGLAADAACAAGFLISRACYVDKTSPLFGSRISNFIHDEFVVETNDDTGAPEAAEELARLMVTGAQPFIPDVPPIVEVLLSRQWSKRAKPMRDTRGRLIPWSAT